MSEPFRGIYPALQATFDTSGEIDITSMERQVAHCIEAGTHGLVFPVMGGELFYLSESERKRLVEAVVGTAKGQVPVIAGVAAPNLTMALPHARHAKEIGADGVVALPPYVAHASQAEQRTYYEGIAAACELPVFIQHSWAGTSAAFMAELIKDVENISYVKEEMRPSGHSIGAAIAAMGQRQYAGACKGVFGGAHGHWMIPEMRRGAAGFIPAAQTTELYAAVWNAFQAGDETKARALHKKLMPMLNLLSMIGLKLCKDILVRRGVIASATMRLPGSTDMDEVDEHELDIIMRELEPTFTAS